jgi:hypothetical protein
MGWGKEYQSSNNHVSHKANGKLVIHIKPEKETTTVPASKI